MKTLLIASFLFLNGFIFSQKADLNTVKTFWDTNIYEIIILDQEGIEKHTHFPVEGNWGYILNHEDPESTTDEDFTHNLKAIFTEEVRVVLRNQTYNDLVHHTDKNGALNFIVQVMATTQIEDSGEVMESMMILYFKKYEGEWKLFQIELTG